MEDVKDIISILGFQSEGLVEEIKISGDIREYDKDDIVVDIGQNLTHFPIVLKGGLKVYKEDENGNEMLLYIIKEGEICAVGLKCCFDGGMSQVRASTDDHATVLMIPVDKIYEWTVRFPEWFRFIINALHTRIANLFDNVDQLAFGNLEQRLMTYLNKLVENRGTNTLKITHLEIANDLNSSREVISRLLKHMEKENRIKLGRGKVTIM